MIHKNSKSHKPRIVRSLLAGTSALLLVVGLSLLLSHFQVLAQPAAEATAANLHVKKDVSEKHDARPGDRLTYTIRIWNDGDTGTYARLTDTLPSELSLITESLTASAGTLGVDNNVITWSHPNLGYQAFVTFVTQISPSIASSTITNTAQVTGTGELIQSSAATTIAIVEPGSPQLEASKSVYPSWARPGELLTYTVSITNTGDASAETVWMTDRLPSLVAYDVQILAATMGSFGEAGGVITWNATLVPSGTLLLPDGERATITFTVRISPELAHNVTFTNTAEITGAGLLVPARAKAQVRSTFTVYLPLVFKRWPPIPYAPVLSLDNPEVGINDYVVSWSHDHPDVSVTSYTLEEASNVSFTDAVVVYSGPATEKEIIDHPDGTYYYHVRGYNQYGYGAWSNIESVTVFTVYEDYFDDSSSGWPNEKKPIKDDQGEIHGYWHRRYYNGQYRIYIEQPTCWTCGWFYQPDALAPYRPPTDKYCVETKVKFEHGAYWASLGLVFGADEANRKLYALCLSRGSDPDRLGGFLMRKDDYTLPMRGCSGPTFKIEVGSEGTSRSDWNRLQIGVDGEKVKVYMGGIYKGEWTMEGLSDMTRVGVIGGDYEILPVDIRYEYFRVLPNTACTP
jgi:uncharacterized repeat protein (TIGR01451 family)